MFFDITRMLGEDTAVYGDDPPVSIYETACIDRDGYALSVLSLCTHSGTHIDAPAHYIPGGATAADIPIETLVGLCDVAGDESAAARAADAGCKRLILLFVPRESLIRHIAESGVVLVGTPELTIGGDDAHRMLLSRGIVLLESLNMEGVPCGTYELIVLPLKISADGSPVRAVLKEIPR